MSYNYNYSVSNLRTTIASLLADEKRGAQKTHLDKFLGKLTTLKPVADECMALRIVEDENYKLHLQRTDQPTQTVGLYLVVLTLQRHDTDSDGNQRKLHDAVSTYYVLAESEEGAISQVDDVAFGLHPHECYDARQRGHLTGTATRLPLHIRGWGSETF